MPRHASKKHHPTIWILVLALLLIAVSGGYYLYRQIQDPFRTLQSLEVNLYLENANSLRGNVYKLNAIIDDALAWSHTKGRLLSVKTISGDSLPILIPATLNHINLQKGQKFYFQIKVSENGILHVQNLKKA